MFDEKYDVVVVGAGHAGCEAAHAAARMGLNTAIYTMNADLIAQMSCNPAIGGIAKGHLVREIDALGGVMGLAGDEAGIQFRLLNTSRGPAVWSPRAQADKAGYRYIMRRILERTAELQASEERMRTLVEHAPEAIVVYDPLTEIFGLSWRLAGLSFTHESNGQAAPLSRSWNRAIGLLGLERGDFALQMRIWTRLTGQASYDDLTA